MKTIKSLWVALLASAIIGLVVYLIFGGSPLKTSLTEGRVTILTWEFGSREIFSLPEGISRAWVLVIIFIMTFTPMRTIQKIFIQEKKNRFPAWFSFFLGLSVTIIFPGVTLLSYIFAPIDDSGFGFMLAVLGLLVCGVFAGLVTPATFWGKGNIFSISMFGGLLSGITISTGIIFFWAIISGNEDGSFLAAVFLSPFIWGLLAGGLLGGIASLLIGRPITGEVANIN